MTDGSRYLVNCGIDPKYIESWLFEPWYPKSIKEALTWWDEEMLPVIRQLMMILNQRTGKSWKALQATSPYHSDFKVIRVRQRDVREMWYKRPRFKSERGRVMEEGY